MGYDVYSEFDIKKHKENYTHYLEIVILNDGTIKYAVPSHQEMAIKLACEKLKVNRQELCEMTPREYYFDWLTWLCDKAEIIAVWSTGYVGKPNRKQFNKLKVLKLSGVYEGSLRDG